jgi:phage shock protein C
MRRRHYRYKYDSGINKCRQHYHGFMDRLGGLSFSRGIYRSSRGVFMGVCRGIAEYFDLNVFRFRLITFILFIFTGLWSVGGLYILAALLMKMEPAAPLRNEDDADFYDSYSHSGESAIKKIKKKFDNMERRIQMMEDMVTSREFMN